MSYVSIRAALETRLNALSPQLPTAWENVPFTQPTTAFQRVNLLPGKTETPTFGGSISREVGVMQVALCYPIGGGSASAITRAELLRDHFPRGLRFSSGGISVIIKNKPSISPGNFEPGLYVVNVSIPYWTDIFN